MTGKEILDRTLKAMTASTVFGTPHTQGDITVIPAATVRGGGGGGVGSRNGEENGEGAGFWLHAHPAGALTITGDKVAWKVPFDLNKVILGGQVVGVAYFVFAWLTERSKARAIVAATSSTRRSGFR